MTKKLTQKEFNKLAESYYFESSWSNGGTWCDYNNNSGTYDAEEPVILKAHIEFLTMYFPEVNMRTFSRINDLVVLSYQTYSDYYGGSTSDNLMHIKLEDIAQVLVEDGYLEFVEE